MKLEILEEKREKIENFIKNVWKDFSKESGDELTENDFYFSVTEKNKLIGYMHIKITCNVGYLKDMILKIEYRNKGIGHKMLEFFERFSKEHKCHKMRIKTCPERNPAAYHLYKKFGFKEEATLKNDYFNKDWVILSKYTNNKLKK